MSAWLPDPFTALWQSSVLIVLVAVAIRLLGERLSAQHALHLAWLPFLPLVLPASVGNELRWQAPWLDAQPQVQQQQSESTPTEAMDFAVPAAVAEAHGPTPLLQHPEEDSLVAEAAGSWAAWSPWQLAWFVVAAGLALLFARGIRRTEQQLRKAQPLTSLEKARLHALVPEARSVELLQSTDFHSPAAWGWMRPRVVIPPDVLMQLDDDELAWVVRHELAHHARRDLHSSVFQRLLQIVWWFHPLLWLWQHRIEELRELACDARAAESMRNNPRPAANALLAIAAQPESRAIALGLHSHRPNPSLMKTRLTRLMRPRDHRAAGFVATFLALALGVGTAALGSVSIIAPLAPTQEPEPIVIEEEEPPPPEEHEAPEEIIEEYETATEYEPIMVFKEETVTYRGQLFLIKNQRKDGSWPTGVKTGFPEGVPIDDASGEFTKLGVTALALLALEQRHPEVPKERWQAALRRGMEYLHHSFDQDKRLFLQGKSTVRAVPDHFIATYAALRLHEHGDRLSWINVRKAAVEQILEMRNPYMGWRYSLQPDGDNDTVLTSMALRVLGLAKKQGILEDRSALEGGRNWIREVTDPETGRVGYQKAGSPDPRFHDRADDYPVKYTELCTAISLLAQEANGLEIIGNEVAMRGLMLVASKAPVWNRTHGSVDYYYWMYGAEAMNLVGGKIAEHWHVQLRNALASHQLIDGSWPAVDAWSEDHTNVHSTAVALIAWQAAGGK